MLVGDERPACVVVVRREQRVERDVGVAVERVAVGEGELRALGHDVDELGLRERRRSKPSSSASCCSATGPEPHGCVLQTVIPR